MCRNAFDWAPSMHRTPWGAREHCNASWEEFLRAEWSPGSLPGLLCLNNACVTLLPIVPAMHWLDREHAALQQANWNLCGSLRRGGASGCI